MVFMFIAAYAARYVERFWIIAATGVVFALGGIVGLLADKKRFTKYS